jgi:hypothetical protein
MLQVVVHFSLVSIPGQLGCSCEFFLGLLGDLFSCFLGGLLTLPYNKDFSITLEVSFQWRLVDWIRCG